MTDLAEQVRRALKSARWLIGLHCSLGEYGDAVANIVVEEIDKALATTDKPA